MWKQISELDVVSNFDCAQYKSAILPNLTYCHIVWHFCKAADARKLERVQERALRAVYNDRNATYEELLEKGRLSSLENRRLQDILILMYKVKNSLAPEHACNTFFQQDKHYNLRSDFPVPRYNTVKYGKHSIRFLGPHIWGKISQELRSKTSLQSGIQERGACSQCAWLAGRYMWLLRMLILGWWVCILASAVWLPWCIESVLPYPLFNSSNLNCLDF